MVGPERTDVNDVSSNVPIRPCRDDEGWLSVRSANTLLSLWHGHCTGSLWYGRRSEASNIDVVVHGGGGAGNSGGA